MSKIHPTAIIYDNVIIHEGVEIGAYCVIGAPAERNGEWESKGVEILPNAKLHGFNTVDAGTEVTTIIGSEVQMLKHAHVGHDAYIGYGSVLSCGARIGGHAHLQKYVNIGLNATVHQWKHVPTGVMLGMNSTITKKKDLQPYSIYAGVPARYIGENKVLKQRLEL